MVKLSGIKADCWLESPDANFWAVLLYGPNLGLVRARAEALINFYSGGNLSDPFAIARIDDDRLRADPSALRDEAFSQSLLGAERILWIRNVAEKSMDEVGIILESSVRPNTLLIEAGDLSPRSKIRRLFEKKDNVVSIGCYEDDAGTLRKLVRDRLDQLRITADPNAVDTLIARLGPDRLNAISEIEKICLYAGQGGELSDEIIPLIVGGGSSPSSDKLIFAIFNGERKLADNLLCASIDDGLSPIRLIRQLQSHVDRLLTVRAAVDQGETIERAMRQLNPPVFFKYKKAFGFQVNAWPTTFLCKCFSRLLVLEMECKSTGMPDIALCQRMALSISGLAYKLVQQQQ